MRHFKINPYLVKKGFYVSSMYWGDVPGDGFELISSDVVAGPFKTAKRAARTGRNPQTGAELKIPARTVPSFKAGAALKSAVN